MLENGSKALKQYLQFASISDIDECVTGTNGCNQTCTNTIGSYECSCDEGYMINATDAHACDGKWHMTVSWRYVLHLMGMVANTVFR